MSQYYLTEQDRTDLRRLRRLLDTFPQGKPMQPTKLEISQSPEVYVVKVPTNGIPARVGTKPGVAACELYRPALEIPSDPDSDYILEAVYLQAGGDIELLDVFNIYFIPVYDWNEEYVQVYRNKFGQWFCEKPYNSFYAIFNAQLNQGSTAEVEFVRNPTAWQRTGVTTTVRDYFLNVGTSIPVNTKLEMNIIGSSWVWRVAYCAPTDTPPAAAS